MITSPASPASPLDSCTEPDEPADATEAEDTRTAPVEDPEPLLTLTSPPTPDELLPALRRKSPPDFFSESPDATIVEPPDIAVSWLEPASNVVDAAESEPN